MSMSVTALTGKRITRAAIMKDMNKNRKKEPEKPTWFDSVFKKIPRNPLGKSLIVVYYESLKRELKTKNYIWISV